MAVKERLQHFIKYKGLTNKAFELQCGLGNGFVSKVGDSIRREKLILIANAFPDLNIDWIINEKGEMLNAVAGASSSGVVSSEEMHLTYLIPMSAMAGSLAGFDTDGLKPSDCERIVSPIAGVDFAIPVKGDSMEPHYPSGSHVLIKKIDPSLFIEWGNVFVLDTTNGIILKEVQPSETEGYVTCHSLNPNGKYKDFDVPMPEIRAMYKVLACVSMR